MGKVFIISDPHFGHTNIALKRGFLSVEDHDKFIIDKWNSVLSKRDTLWILGDITMEKSSNYSILDKINGFKKIVLGNHDQPQHVPELLKHVNSVCGMVKYKGFIFSHCPIHESEIGRFAKNIHGHVHENTLSDDRYVNVSCEAVDYTPVELSTISLEPTKYTPEDLKKDIAQYYGFDPKFMSHKSRKKEYVEARYVAFYWLKMYFEIPFIEAGTYLGGRDHSTGTHALKVVDTQYGVSGSFRVRFDEIRNIVMPKIKKPHKCMAGIVVELNNLPYDNCNGIIVNPKK